jgi:diguanylate cyclase (GGDEF)-like protein
MSDFNKFYLARLSLLMGLVFTVAVSYWLFKLQQAAIAADFRAQIKLHAIAIERELELNAETLHSLKGLFESSEHVTADEFSRSSKEILARHGDIIALEWLPRVSRAERVHFEQTRSKDIANYEFTERGSSNQLISASARDIYFPIYYVEPLGPNIVAVGFDLYSDSIRKRVVDRVIETGEIGLSPSINLVQARKKAPSALLVLPVYAGPSVTVQQRNASLMGLVVAVIDVVKLAYELNEIQGSWRYQHEIYEILDHGVEVLLASQGAYLGGEQIREFIGPIGERTWTLKAEISPSMYFDRQAFMPLLVLLAGLLLFLLLAFNLWSARRKTRLVELLVSERTAALDAANKRLQEISDTDDLSGLGNRRSIDRTLLEEWGRMTREARPLAVMMIDVDHFKSYNDFYGHLVGDTCLRKIAETLGKQINRPADFIGRYGGEEFLAVLPNTDQQALGLAERCRKSIEELGLPHAASNSGNVVTISIGVAYTDRPTADLSPWELVKTADNALYEAKVQGRNRTSFAVLPACAEQEQRLDVT